MKRLALLFSVLTLTACGGPETVDQVHGVISLNEQKLSDGSYDITVEVDSGQSNPAFSVGSTARDAGELLANNPDGKVYSVVQFVAVVPTVDKLGNEGTAKAYRMILRDGVIHRVNWKNFVGWDLMNLAELENIGPIGRQVLGSYCSDSDMVKYSRDFCKKFMVHMLR